MTALVSVLHKKGQSIAETAVKMLEALSLKEVETFGIASPFTVAIGKEYAKLNAELDSSIIVGYAFQKILSKDKPQPIKLGNSTLVFEGRIYGSDKRVSDVETASNKLRSNPKKDAETLIAKTKGDFTFAIAQPSMLIVGRDPVGTRPLYYGENDELIAFASNRKAILKADIKRISSFPPGHLGIAGNRGLEIEPVKILACKKVKRISQQDACAKLQTLLEESVKERLSDSSHVAIAFSGGLDSSMLAQLSKKARVNVTLIHVSLANQPETDHAVEAAGKLDLPIHVRILDEEDVRSTITNVLMLVEEADPLKISVGIPIYWTAREASKMKLKVMLAGQGADELFGGYKKYADEYRHKGAQEMERKMLNDIVNLHVTNLDRDSTICSFHGVELRLPFAAYEIAEFAMNLPTKYKIEHKQKEVRKLILRQVAQRIGLPASIVKKPKKAIQYSTGVNSILKKLAKSHGGIRKFLQYELENKFKRMI